jgi:hypothetical protein
MKIKTILASVALGALGMAASHATLITFDDVGLTALDDITTQYAGLGVTFGGITDSGASVNIAVSGNSVFPDNNPVSAPLSLSNFYGQSGGNRAHIMQIIFTSSASGISFYYNGAGGLGASTIFNVYDTTHTLLSSFSVASAIDSSYHLVSVANQGVGEIDVVNPTAGWGHYLDNLSFNLDTTRAPEVASTAALLAGSLALLGAIRRKLS